MIKDITLGQFFPGESLIHRLDPRTKIVLTCAYMAALFCTGLSYASLGFCCAFLVLIIAVSRVPVKMLFKGIKPVVPIIILTTVINIFYYDGHPMFTFYFLKPTWEGLRFAIFMTVRLIFLIAGTSMMTYTTSPIALSDGMEQLLAPLKVIKLPVHELSMMMSIALRFIPTLVEETDKIMSAQKARGADFESGRLMQRIRALLPILIPLFVSAFRRAEELALAMDCRCYKGGKGRTRLRKLRFAGIDLAALVLFIFLFGGLVALRIYLP